MEYCLNVIKTRGEILVAVCDAELLGKIFREGEFKLEVSEAFYGTKKVNIEIAVKALKEATIGNLIGNRIIKRAIRENLIGQNSIIKIDGIPHAQFLRL
ncbi:MAG: DUF424 family protein [Euryarchaeota archaeon]|nr:DUF424 family protein [Euryarchaeota archaeon]